MSGQRCALPFAGAIIIFMCVFALPAVANDARVVQSLSSAEMRELFLDEGYRNVEIDSDDDLIVKIQGYNVVVFVRGNNYTNIQFRLAIAGTKATLSDVNEWNRTMKFTKAYLDEDGDPVLEMDVDLEGGVTLARIKDAIRTFARSQESFTRDVAR